MNWNKFASGVNKLTIVTFLTVCTAFASYFVYSYASSIDVNKNADDKLEKETITVQKNNKALQTEIDALTDEIKKLDESIESKSTLQGEVQDYRKEKESLENEITVQTQKLDDLTNDTNEAKESLKKYEGISNEEIGEVITKDAGTYKCPDDIAAGRYKARGLNNIVIKGSDNVNKRSFLLGKTDQGTYTFNIEEGDSLVLESEVSLTPVN